MGNSAISALNEINIPIVINKADNRNFIFLEKKSHHLIAYNFELTFISYNLQMDQQVDFQFVLPCMLLQRLLWFVYLNHNLLQV